MPMPISEATAERFWAKVTRPSPEACWEWTAFVDRHGYGRFTYNGDMVQTHRFSYQLAHQAQLSGPLPTDIEVCHRCDNPKCCNPAHLFLGTHQDNMTDMSTKKRARTLATSVKVTRSVKQAIRAAWDTEKVTKAELAERFGVHITTVTSIIQKHVKKASG